MTSIYALNRDESQQCSCKNIDGQKMLLIQASRLGFITGIWSLSPYKVSKLYIW